MADGSALFRFKKAFFTQLDLVNLNVMYDSPTNTSEYMGADGYAAVMWLGDDADATIDTPLLMGTPLWVDETINCELIIQVLGSDTSYDQQTVDQTAATMLGSAIAILLTDPSVGVADDSDIQLFTALPIGWKNYVGTLPSGARAAGFKLEIEVKARLKLATVTGNP